MKFRVYCDTGGCNKELRSLEKNGDIEIFYYPYENKNKFIKQRSPPSRMTWGDMIDPWNENFYPWKAYSGSKKFIGLTRILSLNNNRKDILHLDSAYKSECHFFVTSDKVHIYSKRNELFNHLKIFVCLHTDISQIINAIQKT